MASRSSRAIGGSAARAGLFAGAGEPDVACDVTGGASTGGGDVTATSCAVQRSPALSRMADSDPRRKATRPSSTRTSSVCPSRTRTKNVVPTSSSSPSGTPTRVPINPFLANDPNAKARRLARALISDLVTYFPQKREEGLRNGTTKELFREEIKKSYEEFVEQVGKDLADSTQHFQDALNDILGGGQKIF